MVKFVVYVCSICDFCNSYVVIGGFGGFGLELVYWLVERGVCNLIFISCCGKKIYIRVFGKI